eukprot:143755_1
MSVADVRDTTGYQYCMLTFSIIVTFLMCIIFVVEMYHTIVLINKQKSTKTKCNIFNTYSYYFAFPLGIYFCYILHGLCNIIVWLKLSENCTALDQIATLCYVVSKLFLYEFFILRLHVIYSQSCFKYNSKILI